MGTPSDTAEQPVAVPRRVWGGYAGDGELPHAGCQREHPLSRAAPVRRAGHRRAAAAPATGGRAPAARAAGSRPEPGPAAAPGAHEHAVQPASRRELVAFRRAGAQMRGRAEILDWSDAEGSAVFRRFLMGWRILEADAKSCWRGETRVCFLKITPDPVIRTYAVGYSVWDLRRRMESVAATVRLPAAHQASRAGSGEATASFPP